MKALDALAAKLGYVRPLARVPVVAEGLDAGELLEPEFLELYERAKPFTMTSRERMYALWQAVRAVRGLDGDVVECGVWRGGSSILAALTLSQLGDARTLWMYDTYEGMPDPGPEDVDLLGMSARGDWERLKAEDGLVFARASLADVQANVAAAGVPAERVRFVVGKVEDTIPGTMPDRIALLRLDTDWYESTLHELRHLWDRLVPGGVLIIDDYGHWQGARRAVDEFFAARADAPMLTRIDYTGRLAVKLPART
jgi:hypothetical protein